jgi:TonB family protein
VSVQTRMVLLAGILISTFLSGMSQGSKPTEDSLSERKEFSSAEGGFQVFFPKSPKKATEWIEVGRVRVKTHTYSATLGSTYSVMYFDVPHLVEDPKITADLLVGIRNFVLTELKGRLLSDSPILVDNNAGRLLEISLSDGAIAQAMIIVAGHRLFRVMAVSDKHATEATQSAETVQRHYLESFKLIPVETSTEGEVDRYLRAAPELFQRRIDPAGDLVPGGVLNGRAITLQKPEYPAIARGVHASGTVTVRIVIDEEGRVIAAQAEGGHQLLHEPSVEAARRSRFSRTLLNGKPVKVYGMITFNFVAR